MSELQIYSVLDTKSGKFLSLELFTNDLECERFLQMTLKGQNGVMSQFPEDFKLYRLGTFDAEKGIENVIDVPQWICDLSSLVTITPSLSGNEEN